MIDLTPTGATTATAVGLSGAQQFGNVGFPSATAPGTTENHAVLWSGDANGFTDLGVGTATAVGDGQQVGFDAFGQAALWTGTPESFVNLNPAGWNTSAASGVGGGQQVGVANQQRVCGEKKGGCGSGTYTVFQPFMWTGSAASAIDLHPAGYTSSQARATNGVQQAGFGWVNNAAQIPRRHALVWSGSAASVVDLNQFMPLGFTDAAATGIDAAGNVVGWAVKGSANGTASTHAVMWTPSEAAPNFSQGVGLSQSSVVAGDSVQVNVTLSQPAPAGGALVTLTSNNAAASVPASVLVPAGLTSASFNVQTNPVTTFVTATLTATYGTIPSTQTARLVVAPPPATVDTVSIQKADYVVSKKQLTVQASSTSQTVMLTVTSTATGQVIGVLTNKGAGSYAGTFPLAASPQNITVTSDFGGAASRAVTLK
jgi:hypothetical protein